MIQPEAITSYYEYDFKDHISQLAVLQVCDLNRHITTSELAFDMAARTDELQLLADVTNQDLETQGFLRHDVRIGTPSALITGIQTRDDYLSVTPEIDEAAISVGTYQGVAVFQQPIPNSYLRQPRLCHKIMLRHEAATQFREPIVAYGYYPIEDQSIEIMRPAITHLPNERWLKSLSSDLYMPNIVHPANLRLLEPIYQRIAAAKRSKVGLERNVDWLITQIYEVTQLVHKPICVIADGFMLQSGASEFLCPTKKEIDGTLLGFCTMPKLTFYKQEAEWMYEISDTERELAICIETIIDDQAVLAKVPVSNLLPNKDTQAG